MCLRENRNVVRFSPSSWKEFYKETSFPATKKAFEKVRRAEPNLQPIAQDAYDLKLNAKEGLAVLVPKKCEYHD